MKQSARIFFFHLKVNIHCNVTKNYEGAWTLTKLQSCNEEAVVGVDIDVGDDDARVEKSPKSEKPHEI